VLCHGNVCRSPYAALYLARLVEARGLGLMVTQGGFIGPGRRSPVTARACARAAGIELRRHRSRLFTAEDLTGRTLVVVMEQRQARRMAREHGVPPHRLLILGDLDPESIEARDIPDPWRHGPEVFEVVYRRIARCTEVLAASLRPAAGAEAAAMRRAGATPDPGSGHPLAPGHKPEEVRSHHA
jgi:protein-tyrosine phosphatase